MWIRIRTKDLPEKNFMLLYTVYKENFRFVVFVFSDFLLRVLKLEKQILNLNFYFFYFLHLSFFALFCQFSAIFASRIRIQEVSHSADPDPHNGFIQ